MLPFTAIVFIPIFFALIGGFGSKLGDMMLTGIELVAPTAVLLLFAILFFGVVMDSGMFDPLSKKILQIAGGDPVKIAIGTAILTCMAALDGDGTTTYMIVCSAMLPIYKKLEMNRLILATIAVMSLSIVAGSTPWGGSATRAISILGVDSGEYFRPMIPIMISGIGWILLTAYILGLRERKRLGLSAKSKVDLSADFEEKENKSKKLMIINLIVTIILFISLLLELLPLPVLFLTGFCVVLILNFKDLGEQKKVIKKHASNAIPVVSLVLGAGIFTGILQETQMVNHMAGDIVSILPESIGHYYIIFVTIICIPLSFVMSNDAFFFGAVPVLAETGQNYGVPTLEIARASAIGEKLHFLGPTSAPLWVLIELVKTELGALIRYAWIWVVLSTFVMMIVGLLIGALTI